MLCFRVVFFLYLHSFKWYSFKWPRINMQQNTRNDSVESQRKTPVMVHGNLGMGNSHINTSKLIWRGFNWSVGCQRKTSAPKLQVVVCSLPFFFGKKKERYNLSALSVYIYLLFTTLTMCLVPYFAQLSFV